jgi:pteridine reductase
MTNSSRRAVALVTGAGRRVGNVIARTLAAHGYAIVLHAQRSLVEARSTAEELVRDGHDATALGADLRDESAVKDLVRKIVEQFGQIDALVNCAAVWLRRRLEETTAEDVRHHFDVNTLGTFLCCQHVGLQMVTQSSGGSMVNIGDWAIARPYVDYAAYFPSKGAIPALTRMFAVELGMRNPNVRVNAVLPGPVLLPADLPADERQAVIRATLVRREGRPENVAHAVLFLLENDFVTGVCLPVDGGRSVYAD